MARVGAVLAPIIGREVAKYDRDLVIVIFALVALLSGTFTLFLPETNGNFLLQWQGGPRRQVLPCSNCKMPLINYHQDALMDLYVPGWFNPSSLCSDDHP